MELLVEKLDMLIVVVGSLLGAIKASFEFDKDKHCVSRAVDVMLGVFIGTMMASHYGSQFNHWLTGLIALIGGVSGAMVIEVFMQMLPSLAKKFIAGIAKRWQ